MAPHNPEWRRPSGLRSRLELLEIYGTGIAVQPGTLWSRFKDARRAGAAQARRTSRAPGLSPGLFGGSVESSAPALLAAARNESDAPPVDACAGYRNRTLYLFLAEGIDELLAIRSGVRSVKAPAAVTLADVCATMAGGSASR